MNRSSLAVANRFLDKAGSAGLTPMQVLKLTYLAQGWMLGLYGTSITEDDVQAWRYGPVFPNIYGNVARKQIVKDLLPVFINEEDFTPREKNLIDLVWDKYGRMSGLNLSALTHIKDSPWDVTYRKFGQNAVIPKDEIRNYYFNLAA